MGRDRVDLCGMPLARLDRTELVEHVMRESERGGGGWIITANVDYLQRFESDPTAAELLRRADFIVADGVPLLWACRLRKTPLPDRVAGSDLVWLLAEQASCRHRSLYLLGGNPGAAEAAARALRLRWPGLAIAGYSSPELSNPPTPRQLESLRADLAVCSPDIVYVALGAPKQDFVIDGLRECFPAAWWIGVGISLSFMSGQLKRAPRWMQAMGLEWLFRLLQEPRRLGPRYLVRNLPFAARLLLRSALEGLKAS
jgi:N-acetylglucosaminyldiphosphoundecaprenol N-acetyl-beta-D-mannosaminyltransferase